LKEEINKFTRNLIENFNEFLQEKRKIQQTNLKKNHKENLRFGKMRVTIAGIEFREEFSRSIHSQLQDVITSFIFEYEENDLFRVFLMKTQNFFKPKSWTLPNGQRSFPFSDYSRSIDAYFYIHYYIERILQKIISEELDDLLLEDYTDRLIDELEGKPYNVIGIFDVCGLDIEFNEAKLAPNIILKKGNKDDLEDIKKFAYIKRKEEIEVSHIVMSINIRTTRYDDIYREINEVLRIIRFFIMGDITFSQSIVFAKTVSYPNELDVYDSKRFSIHFRNILKKKDIDSLSKFIEEIKLATMKIVKDDKYRFLLIAIERYEWALLEKQLLDRLFLSAVIGLEALFSKEKESSVTKQVYCFRIAKFLSFFGLNPMNIKRDFAKAYSFRNNIVHGNIYDEDWFDNLKKQYPIILNYLRLSIIFFLLNNDLTKNQILSSIDESLLGINDSYKIEERITKMKKRYPDLICKLQELTGYKVP